MTIEVRQPRAADADGIARVHVRGWTEAYAHLVPAQSLARLSVEQRARRWAEMIDEGHPEIWVATEGGVIIGFAGAGLPRGENPPRDRELESLYLLASHYGSGAGQALLDAAIGTRSAFLWVAEDNPRARAFYVRNGFVADGTSATHSLAGTPVEAIRMVR